MQTSMFETEPAEPKRKRPANTTKSERPFWKKSHEERWAEFHAKHPEVYAEILRLAMADLHAGRRRSSIGYLAEQARRNLSTDARDEEGYKINNSARAIIVRKLIADVPALAPLFELRERRAA